MQCWTQASKPGLLREGTKTIKKQLSIILRFKIITETKYN